MDAFNKHMVGVQNDNIVIVMPPRGPISKSDALMMAAWIVTLATNDDDDFAEYLIAVRS